MGLLRNQKVLSWNELLTQKEDIKSNGINQFIAIYKKYNHITSSMYWGDEIESMMCGNINGFKLLLVSDEISACSELLTVEYARYMIESEPQQPYSNKKMYYENLNDEFESRRIMINGFLAKIVGSGFLLNLSVYPNFQNGFHPRGILDLKNKDEQPVKPKNIQFEPTFNLTKSLYFPDQAVGNHQRFISFTRNIRNRRGKCIEGYIKTYKDKFTSIDSVIIDSMGHGMGSCCLQVTVQAKNLEQARKLYDVYAVLGPLMLRLSRASPIANGMLLDTETRWRMLEISVDCRTDEEKNQVEVDKDINLFVNKEEYEIKRVSLDLDDKKRDLFNFEKSTCKVIVKSCEDKCGSEVLKKIFAKEKFSRKVARIKKSRFSSVDCYVSNEEQCFDEYNDIYVPTIQKFTDELLNANIDEKLAKHISSLFIRDPVMAYKDRTGNVEDFENIQSSNWRSVRLKLPTDDKNPENIGWRVEFRTMDIQPTSYENSCLAAFVIILGQAILHFNINLYLPISLVDENYNTTDIHLHKSADYKSKLSEDKAKFYYRKNIYDSGYSVIKLGTLKRIFLGEEDYPGFINIVLTYVDEKLEGSSKIKEMVDFIAKKVSGEYRSVSEVIRGIVLQHSAYKQDSVVNDEIVQHLIEEIKKIQDKNDPSYLGYNK